MSKANILVVEDERLVAKDIQLTLERRGYAVPAIVSSGEAAIEKAAEVQPDLVLMDIKLRGEMDGVEAAGEIRTRFDIPVVYLTAHADDETLQRARITEPFGYILKPFEERELYTNVEMALYKHQMERQLQAIHQLGRELTLLRDEAAIIQQALERAFSVLRFEFVGYAMVDEAAGELKYRQRLVNGTPEAFKLRLPLDGEQGISVAVVRSGQALYVPDITQDVRYVSWGDRPSGSELCVPMRVRERVIGVLNVETSEPNRFTPADQQLLQTLADQTAVAIENARLHQDLQDQMQALQETQAQLIHSEKMSALGRLVAAVAHEINNPLQVVQGFLILARKELEGSARRERLTHWLDIAGEGTERIAAIVRRVRDFYDPGREGQRPTNLHAVLESVLELANEPLQRGDVAVETAWAEGLPQISANPNQLEQVFLNMTLNAIDAMPHGGTLRISTVLDQSTDPPTIRLEFSDTGVGMSPEIQSRLFEPFFTTKTYASGLALPISYQIIEAHDGQITATSQEDVGTTFTILLPAAFTGRVSYTDNSGRTHVGGRIHHADGGKKWPKLIPRKKE